MREFWIGWGQANGHSVVPASPFATQEERDAAAKDKQAWPANHSPVSFWETINGKVQ
jgi:hypothetical protein